jgi:glycosyltransferase involved in cell wall biosynthesis
MKPSRNIKIAIVTGSLYMGGAELITLNLGSGLKDLGYDVTVVTVTEPGEWFYLLEERCLGGIHIAGRQQVHPYRHAWRIGKRLRDEGFQVVILTKYTNSERLTQSALNMLPENVVVIPWIHSDTTEIYKTSVANANAWHAAVAVSAKIARRASENLDGKTVMHIPNGLVFPSRPPLPQHRRPDSDIFNLCYLGRLHHHPKNIFILPEVLKICIRENNRMVLHIIGDGADGKELGMRFCRLGLMDHVVFHGAVSNQAVYPILFQSHVLLLPSKTEAMPCAPIEAQFCGCVPIASNLPGITDTIIDNGETGLLVDVADIEGFARAVTTLADDRNRWQKMSRAAMQHAEKYSISAMTNRFDDLIRDCLHGRYPLKQPRCRWLPVNPLALTWREFIPREVRKLGLGIRFRGFFREFSK